MDFILNDFFFGIQRLLSLKLIHTDIVSFAAPCRALEGTNFNLDFII